MILSFGQRAISSSTAKLSDTQPGWARVYLAQGAESMFATVQIAAGDGTAASLTLFIKDAGPSGAFYTNVLTPHGGCLTASATLEPAVPQRVSAATPCMPPTR
jgi:hypothetical protein